MERSLLIDHKEPKVFSSVRRIAEYYLRASKYITRYLNYNSQEYIYKRSVIRVPARKPDKKTKYVLMVGKYDLQDASLWTGPNGAPDFVMKKTLYSNLTLECHIDEGGRVVAIYMLT